MTSIREYMDQNGMTSSKMRGHGKRTITPAQIKQIKQSIAAGNTSVTNLCVIHNVSAPTVRKVRDGGYD